MEKIHKLKLYNFCVAKVNFRKKQQMMSCGTVILTEAFEFAGHMNNDTLMGFFKNGEFQIVYHVESFDIKLIPSLQGVDYALIPISYEYNFKMRPIDMEFVGKEYKSFDGMFSIEFKEIINDESIIEKILSRNRDLFIRP